MIELRNAQVTLHIQTRLYSPIYIIVSGGSFLYSGDGIHFSEEASIEKPFGWDGETVYVLYPKEVHGGLSWYRLRRVLRGPIVGLRILLVSQAFAAQHPLGDITDGRSLQSRVLEAAQMGRMGQAFRLITRVISSDPNLASVHGPGGGPVSPRSGTRAADCQTSAIKYAGGRSVPDSVLSFRGGNG